MLRFLATLIIAGLVTAASPQPSQAQTKELTLWTHWAAEQIKRQYVEEAIAEFESKNPGVKIKASWYEKNALYASLKTALRAGQAPDIFYAEPDQAEYYENNFLLDLTNLNWANIEPWAKQAWSYKGKPYGLPLEAWTVELYYNKKLMADLGGKVPENLQLSSDEFLDVVKKAKAKGITPLALGVGDRPFTGAHLTHEALLQKLGTEDYDKLAQRQAGVVGPPRRRHAEMAQDCDRCGSVADDLHLAEAWRVAHVFPHQSRRADVHGWQLVHEPCFQHAG